MHEVEGPGREAHVIAVVWSAALQKWASETYDGLACWVGDTPYEAALAQIIDRGEEGPYEVLIADRRGGTDTFDPAARRL